MKSSPMLRLFSSKGSPMLRLFSSKGLISQGVQGTNGVATFKKAGASQNSLIETTKWLSRLETWKKTGPLLLKVCCFHNHQTDYKKASLLSCF